MTRSRTMPVSMKRSANTPQRSRKRPRVPKFDEVNTDQPNDEDVNEAGRLPEGEEDEEDIQAEYMEEGGHFVEDIYIPPKLSLTERPTRGERLIIEKIECENFKSYGGIKVMGPFHKSFSAIIGPNGNGKSNIIDAMLFVFGYRAKKIRCKKVSVLIHKSELLPRVSSCAVTVHFLKIVDNGEDGNLSEELQVVPDSRITVCRRAYTNNSSAYWLNSKRVQFVEVAKFLKRSGIDIVHNRFLILQGEVEQIAQMPPKATNTHETGFLEFIDEVIGTKRYERPLFLLKEKMGDLEFQRDEKTQRVQLAQQHKDGLKEPLEKAKVYLHNKNVMIRTHHKLNQVKAHHYRKLLKDRKEKLKDLESSRNEILTRLAEIKKYNDDKKQEYSEAEKAYQIAEAKFKKNRKAMDDADAKYVTLNREVKTSNEERKKKMKELEKVAEELEKLEGLPQRHAAEIEKLEKRKAELDRDIQKEEAETEGDIERLKKEVDACVAEKKKADAEFRKLKSVVDEKKASRNTLQKELDRGRANETAEKEKLEKLKQELQKLHEMVKRKSGLGSEIQPDVIPKKEAEAQKRRAMAAELLHSEKQKHAAYQQLQSRYNDAKDTLDGGQMTDRVDKAYFGAKAQGSFPGLYGRMKDLATIDEKYNVAATVATSMLDNWVVDNDQTAADCIQFLKDHKLPSQNFICVNRMNKDGYRRQFRTPARALRIFDLLKINHPELAPVYYRAYGDTLTAETLDIATQVSYGGTQRYRVISYQGDVVETTGSLCGGGSRITQGKFNSETAKRLGEAMSKKQIDELKAKCDQAEKEYSETRDKRMALENEASQIEKEIQEIKTKMATYHSDLEASKKMIPYKTSLVQEQEVKAKEAIIPERVLQQKLKKIEEIDEELEADMEPYQEAEERVNKLSEKVKNLQEGKRKEILKKLNKFVEQRKRVLVELDKLNSELRNCEKNKTKLENKKTKLSEDKKALEEKMTEMTHEKRKLEEIASKIKEEAEELQQERDEKEKIYTELKSKANEFDQEEKKLNKQKVTADNSFQTLSDEVKGLEKQDKSLQASLEKFELEDIPEVEVDPLEVLTEEQLEEERESVKELEAKVNKYQQKLSRAEPNLNVIAEYNAACEILLQRFKELDQVNERRDLINNAYLTLEAQRMKEFMEGYAMISAKVKELFRMISMGGDAELDLLDSTDPFSCGIDFSVRPRGKTWKKIINLSGGEKTLSSLALVFSLHHFKPSPFYVMDEIDAALDFQNVSIIANYIKDRTKFTQFIIISLRSNMFELADSLLGVYKVDNMSYSIRLGVNTVVNKLKGIFQKENRPFIMGSDDPGSMSSRQRQTTSTQATATSSQSQQTQQVGIGAGGGKRPSFDVSAIRDIDPDASTAETERVPSRSEREPSEETDFSSSIPSSSNKNTQSKKKNDEPQEMPVSNEVETVQSPDMFENSFEGEEERHPIYSSTPLSTTAGNKRVLRKKGPDNHLSNIGEGEEEEESSFESSDDGRADDFFNSLSSANNSQENAP